MGYSVASQQGIKANGRPWKATIRDLPDNLEAIKVAIEASPVDQDAVVAGLRSIAALFSKHMTDDNTYSGEMEALEWFQDETIGHEVDTGTVEDWRSEFDFRLSELYDFADYNRIWVKP